MRLIRKLREWLSWPLGALVILFLMLFILVHGEFDGDEEAGS